MATYMVLRHQLIASAVLVACVGCLAGCISSSMGTKMDRGKVSQITKGVTTQSEVEQAFGAPMGPYTIMPNEKRMGMWCYRKSTFKGGSMFIPGAGLISGPGGDSYQQTLEVVFNKEGTVEDFTYSGGTTTTDNRGLLGGAKTTTVAEK